MRATAGIDVGSTYTKAVVLDADKNVVGRAMAPTGFKLTDVSRSTFTQALAEAGIEERDVSYVVATGFGRHQVDFKDIAVTDLTATARGTMHLFPGTRTVLDIGGQTMKASRVDADKKVRAFRLNDKCAAGTGAFLEKTARYMGYSTEEIGALLVTSKQSVPISGVCAVFAESEVINHLSLGTPPADIMFGAIDSLVGRSIQLMKRVKAEPDYTVVGGLLRFRTMIESIEKQLGAKVNVPEGDAVQFTTAMGAAILAQLRLHKLEQQDDQGTVVATA